VKRLLLLGATVLASIGCAADAQRARPVDLAPARTADALNQIVRQVSEQQLRSTVERLVGFGTRHTLSSQDHPTRGIGAALNWTEAEFRRISQACGGCLTTARPSDMVTGRRIPTPTRITNVIAIQRGTTDPNRVVIITGHIDSRVADVMNATADAPGANDDGSGTAAVIEAARVLSRHRFPATIVYAALSGEEQGLYGGRILADYARAQGWQIEANLNNDIIGNSCGSDRVCDAAHVRVFSEGPRWQGREDLAARQRSLGGENDAPSRNLSRYLEELAGRLNVGLAVRPIWRNDRFGRGGDHTEFLNAGYPAVRLSVAVEDYDHQHQDLRVENGREYGDTIEEMDFAYLANVVRLNVAALASLARAPMPPDPAAEGAVSTDTTIRWRTVPGAAHYVVWWRLTNDFRWRHAWTARTGMPTVGTATLSNGRPMRAQYAVTGDRHEFVLRGIRVDDWVFGVSSVSADGYESPVSSAVPGGAFRPWTPPPAAQQ
jgi:acetylornithine deacetylase/succinyl-diaminopimelate desuccinylase-like protein